MCFEYELETQETGRGNAMASAVVSLLKILMFLQVHFAFGHAGFVCPQAVFAFGDSLSDTGNICNVSPFCVNFYPPSGMTYFKRPALRSSDGRLLIDFIAQAFSFPLPDPYFQSIYPDFKNGVNFAFSGAKAVLQPLGPSTPSVLQQQLNQFSYFKNVSLTATGKPGLPSVQQYESALYFLYIGINDILHGFPNVQPVPGNVSLVHEVVESVSTIVQDLYNKEGARQFLIVNLPPIGCLPAVLKIVHNNNKSDYDSYGCLKDYNAVIELYNQKLLDTVTKLRQQLPKAILGYADCYQVYKEAIANPEKHGFEREYTLTDCYSTSAGTLCSDPSRYISWDGIHYTEAFNRLMASWFLTGKATNWPSVINLTAACDLHPPLN